MNERNGNASSKSEMRAAPVVGIFTYADEKVNEKTFLWSMAG